MPNRNEPGDCPGPLPIESPKRSIGSIATVEHAATSEQSWDSTDFEQAYDDAFYDECIRKNRGGLRDFYEQRDRKLADRLHQIDDVRARGLRLPSADYEYLLSWIDDRRERSADKLERATFARVGRAVTLTIEGATFADACREAGTSRRTVEKRLSEYRGAALAWYRACRRRDRNRASRKRRAK